MTGFVDRVVARGAGLPLLERAATLRLRPVSSFEAGNAGPLSADRAAPVIDDGPRISSNPTSPKPGSPEPYEPAARRLATADPSPPTFDAPEPAGEETTPPRRINTESRNNPFDVSADRDLATRKQSSAADRSSDPAVETSHPVRSVGDNLKIQARPITEERAFVKAPTYQHRDNIPDTTSSPVEVAPEASAPGWRDRSSHDWSEPPSLAAAEAQAPVTVTVGRIDVQFLQPPAPPAASPSVPRSSGFGNYARARRGIPR